MKSPSWELSPLHSIRWKDKYTVWHLTEHARERSVQWCFYRDEISYQNNCHWLLLWESGIIIIWLSKMEWWGFGAYNIRSWLFNYGMDNSCRSVLPFGIKAATKKKRKKKKTANQFFYRNISMTWIIITITFFSCYEYKM